jgi:hypothetical protein
MWRACVKRRTGEWMRSLSRGLWVSLVLSLALAACSAPAAPEPTAPPTAVPPTQTPVPSATPQPLVLSSPTPRVRCEVVAWLDNDTPQVGDQLTLTASLSVNGYLSSASWMKATWPDENAPGGRKVCWDTPSYGRGFCDIRVTDQYTPGQPVYITVELFRQGVWHSGQVHFTPQ